MTATIACWTIEDYHAIAETGLLSDRAVELLNGFIVEMSPEGPLHSDLSTDIQEIFMNAARGRYRTRMAKPISIAQNNSEPEPDIALVRSRSYRQAHPTPDDVYLIVEFARTSIAKDTEEKRLVYAAAGIRDYWVANLRDRCLLVYRDPVSGDYRSQQQITEGRVSPLAFPDIEIEAIALFT